MDEVRTGSSNPADYGYTHLTPREQPPPEVGWKDTEAEGVNMYSQNVVKEVGTTESVDRESIANLSNTKQRWESIFSSNAKLPEEDQTGVAPKKATPKWEVKLPDSIRGGGGGGERSGARSDSNHHHHSSNNGSDVVQIVEANQQRSSPSPAGGKDAYPDDSNNNNTINDVRDKTVPQQFESAIEYEIRIACEREEMLRKEKVERDGMLSPTSQSQSSSVFSAAPPPSTTAKSSNGPRPVLLSLEVVNGESESYQPAYNELAEADRAADVWVLHNKKVDQNESIIEREIRQQREKEEELEKQRLRLAQEQQGSSSLSSSTAEEDSSHQLPPEPDSLSNKSQLPPPSNQPASKSMNVRENDRSAKSSSHHHPSQTTPDNQGTWLREVSPFVSQNRRVSQDSGSSQSAGKISSDIPSRSVSVQPISDTVDDGSDEDDKPDYFKKQETPIEREIRLAKERENELRRMKGMPELSNKDDYFGSYGANTSSQEGNSSQTRPTSYNAPNRTAMKRISTTRLQQEISAQKEREHSMRNEGKILSDSGEQTRQNKYMEVTGSQTVDGSEKRNFVTKKGHTPATEPQREANPAVTPSTGTEGAKKGPGGSSKNFSYKEFRQTAESKIERELREMREREEELRNQRKPSVSQAP